MSLAIRLLPEPVRTLGFASIDGTYMGVGTTLTNPVRIFVIQNLTDSLLMFSFDGINDHLPLPSNGYIVLDVSANKTTKQGFFLAEGERLYVKDTGTPPGEGAVYFTTFCGIE